MLDADVSSQDPDQDGWNWYAYCGNNPLGGVDPTGEKTAVIVVGDTEVSPLWQKAVDNAVDNYVKASSGYYQAQGYDCISVLTHPTGREVTEALSDKDVQALTWIGHRKDRGSVRVETEKDGSGVQSMKATHFKQAPGGRRLEEAVFFVCHSNSDYSLKNAIVGNRGRWVGADGYFNPMLGVNYSIRGASLLWEFERERAIANWHQ